MSEMYYYKQIRPLVGVLSNQPAGSLSHIGGIIPILCLYVRFVRPYGVGMSLRARW